MMPLWPVLTGLCMAGMLHDVSCIFNGLMTMCVGLIVMIIRHVSITIILQRFVTFLQPSIITVTILCQ